MPSIKTVALLGLSGLLSVSYAAEPAAQSVRNPFATGNEAVTQGALCLDCETTGAEHLSGVRYIGNVQQQSTVWGVLQNQDGQISVVKPGDRVGPLLGKVVAVEHLQLTVQTESGATMVLQLSQAQHG